VLQNSLLKLLVRGRLSRPGVSIGFLLTGIACVFLADIEIAANEPWRELSYLGIAFFQPDFTVLGQMLRAVLNTFIFAILGICCAGVTGLLLTLVFHSSLVRTACALVRSVHELFWALIFLQIFGISPVTGILAIVIPYSGILAKVYAEIIDEADLTPLQLISPGSGRLSVFLYVKLPDVWKHIKSFTLYRFECALRSSAVLGFVGLPTLGFHLESSFNQGKYNEVWALLFLFYIIIATKNLWMRSRLLPVYLAGSLLLLPDIGRISLSNLVRFFTHDIIPSPLRNAEAIDLEVMLELGQWMWFMIRTQALPGTFDTIILTQIALVVTAILSLVLFPVISNKFTGKTGTLAGHILLVIIRSTPEYMLAYILLHVWGPSMLPAIVALALHNGALIAYLVGRQTNTLQLRIDSATGLNRYFYEVLPRIYGQFLAFSFYRWEVIFRETAILGILGIHTLGFFVDSAIQDLRFDRAMFLISITALVTLGINAVSRYLRERLWLSMVPSTESASGNA
jgi:phosphonate transport system permease protein